MTVTTKRLKSRMNALADALALEDADADRWAAGISTALPAEETRNPPELVEQIDYAGMWPNEAYSEPDEDITPAPLTEESQAIYLETVEALGKRMGRASLEELRPEIERALRWCQHHHDAKIDGGFERLAWAVVHKRLRAHRNKYGHRHLLRERRDQELREAAMGRHDSAVITYLAHARRVFDNARLAYPRRWFVPGRDAERLYSDLEMKLLDLLVTEPPLRRERWWPYERPGVAATFVVFDRERCALKRRARLVVLTEGPRGAVSALSPSALEAVIEKETPAYLGAVLADGRVSRIQRKWLDAMLEDVEKFGRLNLTRVAERLGKSVSAATRIVAALKRALGRDFDTSWFNDHD